MADDDFVFNDDDASPYDDEIAKALEFWPESEPYDLARLVWRAQKLGCIWEWDRDAEESTVRVFHRNRTVEKLS